MNLLSRDPQRPTRVVSLAVFRAALIASQPKTSQRVLDAWATRQAAA